ncbi:MAG: aldehyde dehydrogenase family protein [Pseudomonadales bacterium]
MQTSRIDTWLTELSKASNGSDNLPVYSPFDGTVIANIKTNGYDWLENALTVAHRTFRDRQAWIPLDERIGILERCARIMAKHHAELVALAVAEGGKPIVDSQIEVTRAVESVRLCAEHLKNDTGNVVPMSTASGGRYATTRYEPIGVVAAVSAFNHPLNLIAHQVAPAIAAGCPVIVKPAAVTPLSCLRFVEILKQAGLPEHWVQVLITDDNDLAEQLVTDSRVGFFSFIGSARVGWMLRSKLAPGVRCALEHGGAAPVILAQDADVERAIEAILKGGFYHAGQVCVSVQRVFVPDAMAHEFATQLAARAAQLETGDPMSVNTQVGPLISTQEVERVHSWVSEAIAEGASCMTGGEPINGRFYPCTVLLNPPSDAKVSQLEIFGPVVNVYSYRALPDAIAAANSLPYAFQAAVFSQDMNTIMHTFAHIDASAVMVNDHSAFRIDSMPFAGLRESGLGVGGIPYTLDDMRVEKMLVLNDVEAATNWNRAK